MKFFKIENNPEQALLYQDIGINRIFLDLEILGKKKRQGHLNTVISESHSINDVEKLSKVLHSSKLLVRINPINKNTKFEIEKSIKDGADVLMLPMFTTSDEVKYFIDLIDGRVKNCLLLETSQALCRIDDILEIDGINEIHIGLNDLHLSMNLKFMFELLTGGLVEYLIRKIKAKNIDYGFGGIAPLDEGLISGRMILKEHVRLGSTGVILSRSFDDILKVSTSNFVECFEDLRDEYINLIENNPLEEFNKNLILMKHKVNNIINNV